MKIIVHESLEWQWKVSAELSEKWVGEWKGWKEGVRWESGRDGGRSKVGRRKRSQKVRRK